jgi:hypothetical protein
MEGGELGRGGEAASGGRGGRRWRMSERSGALMP